MEYYILQCYQNKKKECPEIKPVGKTFGYKAKVGSGICTIIMFVSCIIAIITMVQSSYFSFIGDFFIIGSIIGGTIIERKEQKKHLDQYIEMYQKKLEILEQILLVEFNINSKEKIEELINLYQRRLDEGKERRKKRNGIALTVLSVFASTLTISFENMNIIGLNFNGWIRIAVILVMVVFAECIWLWLVSNLDLTKEKYEMMINDLNGLLLTRY